MRLSGEPARVADGIAVMPANTVSGFSASENGVLVLAWDSGAVDMSWYDRTGTLLSQVAVGTRDGALRRTMLFFELGERHVMST